jgi:peroxiredoxin
MSNYRYADLLPEVELDNIKKTQLRTAIQPLASGDVLPSFHIHKKNILTTGDLLRSLNGSLPVTQIADRPLVIVFYSAHWNQYGQRLLQDLSDLHADVRIMGGQLLLVSSEANIQPLPFASVYDQYQHIATKAGVYSSTDPIWDRVSGIEADVATPAIYVVTPDLKITYSQVDLWFERGVQRRELLSAVYDAAQVSLSVAI